MRVCFYCHGVWHKDYFREGPVEKLASKRQYLHVLCDFMSYVTKNKKCCHSSLLKFLQMCISAILKHLRFYMTWIFIIHSALTLHSALRTTTKSGRTAEGCFKIIWEGGVVETEISNKVISNLEKQLLDKYHPKSNKKIQEKFLEHNYIQQGKWKPEKRLIFKADRRFLILHCLHYHLEYCLSCFN